MDNKPMTPERLMIKRHHAKQNPEGRTAEMLSHIDWQSEKLHQISDDVSFLLSCVLSGESLSEEEISIIHMRMKNTG